MDVLFIHNNFPGQFAFLAPRLRDRGARCAAIGSPTARDNGFPLRRWKLNRGTTPGIFPLAIRAEADLMRGAGAAAAAADFKAQGFDPALIIGHPGWGETLLMKELFPRAKQIAYAEYYYHATGSDADFDPEFMAPKTTEERFRIHAKNMCFGLVYGEADAIVAPTPFQAGLLPPTFQAKTTIIHEGVDVEQVKPRPEARFVLDDGRVLDRSTPVITYVSRRFEPTRGFHILMRALPRLLQARPDAQVLMIGADSTASYQGHAKDGVTFKQRMLREVGDRIDQGRVHWTGHIPYARMLDAMAVSAAHVYYTSPFVLSWSLLDAMASGCLILGSDTPPLRDVIVPGENGVLNPFFDVEALSEAMIRACEEPRTFDPLRAAARDTIVSRYDRERQCLPAWLDLVDEVLAR
jgi:glycosyltransferase involved in cell wall biosynthesis